MENAVLSNSTRTPVNFPAGNDHPVVDLPFTAVIDGRQFRGRGLSLVAAYVAGLMDPAALNATRIARLMFQFDGFAVTLVVDVEVRESAAGSGEAELVFIRPTGPHLPQLRHILNAFIAGDLVGLGQAITVAGMPAAKRATIVAPNGGRSASRRLLGAAGIAALSLALLGLAGSLVYNRVFVTLVPTLGTVVSTGQVLRATATGQIVFLDLSAGMGEVVVAIQAASGDVQSLILPCDCDIRADGLREGSTVLTGEPMVRLLADSDELLVAAAMTPAMVFDLAPSDRIELTFPGGETVMAVPEETAGPVAGSDPAQVLLRPDVALEEGRIGTPVEVRILRGTGGVGSWFGAVLSRVTALFAGV